MGSCADCADPGTFWKGQPSGKELSFGGVSAYVAQPKSDSGKAIILASDFHGWDLQNTRLIADKFAEAGFLAALPAMTEVTADLTPGDKPDLEAYARGDTKSVEGWRDRHPPEKVIPDLEKVLLGLKAQHGAQSIGIIGFCWGGQFAIRLGATDKVRAVVINHGSFITHDLVSAEKQPILFNASDNDHHISRERLAQFQGILDCKKDVPSDVKLFEGVKHGWTTRGDAADPKVGPALVEAHQRTVQWFQKYL